MPRYYFDTLDREQVTDDEGEILADDQAAKVMAAEIASELSLVRVAHIWAGEQFKIVIRDETKLVIGWLAVSAETA